MAINLGDPELWSEVYDKMIAGGQPAELARDIADRAVSALNTLLDTTDRGLPLQSPLVN